MAYKLSGALAQSCHNGPGFKSTLQGPDGFFLHLFSGTVPTAPGDALDMVTTHTLLGVCTVNSDGTTGCTFDAAVNEIMQKAAAETWGGTFAFDGADDTDPSLLATFFRVAPKADNCQGAGAGARLQGTITATGGGGDMERADPECDNGQPFSLTGFVVRIGSLT